jgi:hypothetical protein
LKTCQAGCGSLGSELIECLHKGIGRRNPTEKGNESFSPIGEERDVEVSQGKYEDLVHLKRGMLLNVAAFSRFPNALNKFK